MMNDVFEITTKYGVYSDCSFLVREYVNHRPRIDIYSNTLGPIMTVTVNLPGISFDNNYVAIKDYSENEGISEELNRLGVIVDEPVTYIPSGWVMIPVYRLTEEFVKKYL